MYTIKFTSEFKRQMKLCQRRGYDMELLREVIRILSKAGSLPPEYHPHLLSGNRKGQWECHIQPDWLLIWEKTISIMRDLTLSSDFYRIFMRRYVK